LKGTYYVAVTANSTCSFHITTHLKNKLNKEEDYAIKLEESIPQKGVLQVDDVYHVHFYRIELNLENSWEGELLIFVTSDLGNTLLRVN